MWPFFLNGVMIGDRTRSAVYLNLDVERME